MLPLMVAIGLILLFTYMIAHQQRQRPEDLYHQLFYNVNGYFYQPEKLKDWGEWLDHAGKDIQSDADALRLASELVTQLNDPYTMVIGPELNTSRINFECTECVGVGIMLMAAYENATPDSCAQTKEETGASCTYPTIAGVKYNSPAAHAGIKAGDLLTHVDGWSTANQPLSEVLKHISKKLVRKITITVERDGVSTEHTLRREFLATPTVWGRMIDKEIAYIRLRSFETWVEQAFSYKCHELRKARAVIVDVRDNPGGQVDQGIRLPTIFMREGHITTMHSRVFGTQEHKTRRFILRKGTVYEEADGKETEYEGQNLPGHMFADKPVVVLINENTASAAEMFAGALRDSAGATLVGTKTFGKGVAQVMLHFFGGVQLRITSGKYYLPKGYWPGDGAGDRRGIDPDIDVPPQSRLFDLGSDEDNQLKAAVEQARQKLNK